MNVYVDGLEIEGRYTSGRPAYVSGRPEDCYPEDPDEFEIYSAELIDLNEFLEAGHDLDKTLKETAESLYERVIEEARNKYRNDW